MRKYTAILIILLVATFVGAAPQCVPNSILCYFLQSPTLAIARERLGVAGTNEVVISTNAVLWGQITIIKPNGAQSNLWASANTDASRGLNLSNAVNIAASGDVIRLGAGTNFISTNLLLKTGCSLIGSGTGTLIYGTNLTGAAVVVTNSNIQVSDLRISVNSIGLGSTNVNTVLITNLTFRNIDVLGGENAVTWRTSNNQGSNAIVADFYNCRLSASTTNLSSSIAVRPNLGTNALVRLFNCFVYGYVDGVLAGGNGGDLQIFGGSYTSEIDPITSGGANVYVIGAKSRGGGSSNGDLFEDGGTLTAVWVDAETTGGTIAGDHYLHSLTANSILTLDAGKKIVSVYPTNLLSGSGGNFSTNAQGSASFLGGAQVVTGFTNLANAANIFVSTGSSTNYTTSGRTSQILADTLNNETGTGSVVFSNAPGILNATLNGTNTATGVLISTNLIGYVDVSAKTANFTLTATNSIVQSDATAASRTNTLPSPSSADAFLITPNGARCARIFTVMKSDSSGNTVVVNVTGGSNINGAAERTLTTQYQSERYYSNGTQFFVE